MGMSVRAYARHRGVSHVAVIKAIQSGRITPESDGTIDPAKADAQWASNTRPSAALEPEDAATSPQPRVGAPDYRTSRAIREAYAARLAKLEFEERAGKLISTDEVKVTVFNLARRTRDWLLQIPRRIAPQIVAAVVADPDPRTVEEMLEVEIREALEELTR